MAEPKEDDEIALVCMRVTDQANPISTATITFCHTCHEDVWIAPTSIAVIAQHPQAQVLCNRCLPEAIKAEKIDEVKAAPGAHKELAAEGVDPDYVARVQMREMVEGTHGDSRQ